MKMDACRFLTSEACRGGKLGRCCGGHSAFSYSVAPRSRTRGMWRRAVWPPPVVLMAALVAGLGCSKETPASASKAPVTDDPDVFSLEHPEIFKTMKAETRALSTELTANGTVTPDVTRTIHVTSLGGGRVVDLKVKLGDSVKRGRRF